MGGGYIVGTWWVSEKVKYRASFDGSEMRTHLSE